MRRTATRSAFSAVRTEGGILPAELLERLAAGDKEVPGLAPEDYHLGPHERLGEAVNRSWSRLLGAWASFRDAVEKMPEGDPGTRVTRERWLLPLFQELGYGRLLRSKALEADGKSFALSHLWHRSPIHLLGAGLTLDRRTAGVAGAAVASPHGLVQEYLNRSDDHLWGFVSNGRALRLLRDHHSLTRQAYVELDLETIMEGELYSEFLLLWLICHQSRVEAEKPEECWLERWFQASRQEGVRALDKLRDGVQTAIEALGQGFLRHRANAELQRALAQGALDRQDYYRELLRLVYRLIFLFVAEDRDALLDPGAPDAAKDRYQRFYATRHLRHLADRRRGGAHGDLWQGLRLVMDKLGGGCPELALPALGSFLWRVEAIPHLAGSELGNADLLAAVRALCTIEDRSTRYPVNWRNIGSEELGSIYESLLELHPSFDREAGTFELATAAGHERKTTGSYYTPSSLVDCLLDSALDPVLDEAASKGEPEAAILALTVCDPACGSGHFLVAAARRIAKRLAAVRSGEDEPSPEAVQEALRDVVGRCLYGVDINPMAVELCKVSLWMEAIEPGKPLSFLDHHIRVGNSLLGATPALLEKGIPDAAFKPIEGDDKAFCRDLKKYNKQARESRQQTLFDLRGEPWERLGDLATGLLDLDGISDQTAEGVRRKEERWQEILESEGYETSRMWADAWCAAFVWEKVDDPEKPYPITEQVFRKMEQNPKFVDAGVRGEVRRLRKEYGFFHWHLAFPGVFRVAFGVGKGANLKTGWTGGFDVVVGNPPWDRIKLQEKEWFALRDPLIANARNAAERKKAIARLPERSPRLWNEWLASVRYASGVSHLVRTSGNYPMCGRGDINTYSIFAEKSWQLINNQGRIGSLLPTGIATDDTTKFFFQALVESRCLVRLWSFENEALIFPAVHHFTKFCLLTVAGRDRPSSEADFVFFVRKYEQLLERERHFSLSQRDIALVNPNTRTCPIFRTGRDAEITKAIYRRTPILIQDGNEPRNEWNLTFSRMFDMANDSALFCIGSDVDTPNICSELLESEVLPLYEGKMAWLLNHRYAFYPRDRKGRGHRVLPRSEEESLADPEYFSSSYYWLASADVESRIPDFWPRRWLLGWRDVTTAITRRTVVASILPVIGVGHKFPLMYTRDSAASKTVCLAANLCSLVLDYVARQKLGGVNLSYTILKQLPIQAPASYRRECPWQPGETLETWVSQHVLELVYTSADLSFFAEDMGYDGPPFVWEGTRRRHLFAELDAGFFILYGVPREDIDYILDSFNLVRDEDIALFGDYRTKLQILDIYDAMQEAIDTGEPYQTLLDPPPADPRVAHPPREDEPGAAATVLPFPAVPADEEPYPSWQPEVSEVAQPPASYDGKPVPAETASERIVGWLAERPGWHSRSEIVGDLELSTGQWNTAIRLLVDTGRVEKKGRKRGTRYRLCGLAESVAAAPVSPEPAAETPAERILAWLRDHPGWHARADILAALADLSAGEWNPAIRELVEFGEVEKKGQKRGTRYRAALEPSETGE